MDEENEKKEKPASFELPSVDIKNEDEQLEFTQRVRLHVASGLAEAKDICADHKAINSLAKMLDGIDKQITSKRRIEAADKQAGAAADTANALNELVRSQFGTKPERHDTPPENTYRPAIPALAERVSRPEMLTPPGEVIDVDDIMRAAFKKRKEAAPSEDDAD